jgi:serpin B
MRFTPVSASLVALVASLAAACSSSSSPAGAGGEPPVAKSALARDTAPEVPPSDADTLRTDNTAFAADLYQALAATSDSRGQNLFFSPYSISTALAMTYGGARGATATQMATALHFTLPPDRLARAFDGVDLALTTPPAPQDADDFTLHVVNSTWGAPQTTFVPAFLDTLALDYGAAVRLTDFAANPNQATDTINRWIGDQTAHKIQNLIPYEAIDELTRMVLVNAVYFKARWAVPFDPSRTQQQGIFHGSPGDGPAAMMRTSDELAYGEAADHSWAAASLDYAGGSTMTIVVPKDIAAFEAALSTDMLAAVVSSLHSVELDLTLPKFEIQGASVSLAEVLEARGMTDAFDSARADFSGMSTSDRLYLSDVRHEALISVDEQGTEAAAATADIAEAGSLAILDHATLTVDRPFVFFIREPRTGAILFLGRVLHV